MNKSMRTIHICGIPDGPYRYRGFVFEIHPYLGPCELRTDGEPTNSNPPRNFLKMWDTFNKLKQSEKDLYSVPIRELG